jgi:hypothetical protein
MRTAENYAWPGLSDEGDNYHRNPDGEAGPWCHTTDGDTRWELCIGARLHALFQRRHERRGERPGLRRVDIGPEFPTADAAVGATAASARPRREPRLWHGQVDNSSAMNLFETDVDCGGN